MRYLLLMIVFVFFSCVVNVDDSYVDLSINTIKEIKLDVARYENERRIGLFGVWITNEYTYYNTFNSLNEYYVFSFYTNNIIKTNGKKGMILVITNYDSFSTNIGF